MAQQKATQHSVESYVVSAVDEGKTLECWIVEDVPKVEGLLTPPPQLQAIKTSISFPTATVFTSPLLELYADKF